jgi:hypothetical protein
MQVPVIEIYFSKGANQLSVTAPFHLKLETYTISQNIVFFQMNNLYLLCVCVCVSRMRVLVRERDFVQTMEKLSLVLDQACSTHDSLSIS